MSLNDEVWCKLAPSPIHGIGVFAIRAIPKGQKYTNYGIWNLKDNEPKVFNEEDLNNALPEIRNLILDQMLFEQARPITFYSPNTNACLQSFLNHSNTPNTDGFKAIQDIKKGEELTENYNTVTQGELHSVSKKHHASYA